MAVIFVFAASRMECQPAVDQLGRDRVEKIAPFVTAGHAGNNFVYVINSRMGPESAGRIANMCLPPKKKYEERLALLPSPDAVLVTGFAGGLNEELNEGDIAVYARVRDAADAVLDCDAILTAELSKRLATSPVTGTSVDKIVCRATEKKRLGSIGAAAVDMESFQILSAARTAGIPCAVMRAISDRFDRNLPDLNKARNETGGLNPLKLALVCLASPAGTLHLSNSSRKARQTLRTSLSTLLGSDIWDVARRDHPAVNTAQEAKAL